MWPLHITVTKKNLKIVLYRLHKMEKKKKKIVEELKINQINVLDIKIMNVQKERYSNHATYLLYFERGSIKLNDLKRNCRSLFHTIIQWDFYRSTNKGQPVVTTVRRLDTVPVGAISTVSVISVRKVTKLTIALITTTLNLGKIISIPYAGRTVRSFEPTSSKLN